uniref:Leukocyte cell-derived chemotaxin 1 n=1 Tax=Poecilia mexicana TaxID=48701 RepID=A0A3B3YFJ6_9TELE
MYKAALLQVLPELSDSTILSLSNKLHSSLQFCFILTCRFECCQVYSVRYSLNINGKVREGSMKIDSDNNLQRFQTGSEAGEAVEIHDFQIGITGIRFFGGDKCYIKSHIKANLSLLGAHNKDTLMFDLVRVRTDELMPVRFDEEFLIWVAAKQSLKNTTFLSNTILDLCGELPVFWLQPIYPKGSSYLFFFFPDSRDPERRGEQEAVDEGQSAMGAMTFDSMLDHQGICCSECQRSYTHCQRVCEPLRGYWPWPYNYRGCQVACRVIMPCRWWVARILGVV